MQQFLSTPTGELTFIPFDIETTGFRADDVTTTLTLEHDGEYHAWLNTAGRDTTVGDLRETVREESDLPVTVYAAKDEEGLLSSVRSYMEDNIPVGKTVLVAYNGEKWKGGFDLKFLRTRCVKLGVTFPFKDYHYADAIEVFSDKDRFNTIRPGVPQYNDTTKTDLASMAEFFGLDDSGTKSDLYHRVKDADLAAEDFIAWGEECNDGETPTRAANDLCGVHELLIGDGAGDYDPYDESEEAIEAFEDGEFASILLHNLADVEKTRDLTDIMVEHAPKYDYRPKTL